MSSTTPPSAAASAIADARRRSTRFAPLALVATCVLAFVAASPAGAAPAPVGLGTATSFAILAGSGVTNTGATTVTGDIGTFPTTSQTGFGTILQTGVNHAGDAVTQQAKLDLVDAYDDAAARGPRTAAVPVDLAGQVLTPGVYGGGTIELSGALTLDAQGDPDAVFVFQAASTLKTASASSVTVINGGPNSACNVYWQVGSSATLGAGSTFVGTVLAQQTISLQSTAVVEGRLLARTGAVTLINNTITNTGCATLAVAPGAPTTTTTTTTTTAVTDGSGDGSGSPARDGSGSPSGDGSGSPGDGTPNDRSRPPGDGITTQLAFTGSGANLAMIGGIAVAGGAVLMGVASTRRRRAG